MGRAWRFRISSFWPFTKVELKRRVKFADFIISARFLSRESWNTLSRISPTFFPTFHFEFFWSLSKGIELSISLENGNRNERERERKRIIQRRFIRITGDLDLPRSRRRIDIIPLALFFPWPRGALSGAVRSLYRETRRATRYCVYGNSVCWLRTTGENNTMPSSLWAWLS